jgi:hypothetical protein
VQGSYISGIKLEEIFKDDFVGEPYSPISVSAPQFIVYFAKRS